MLKKVSVIFLSLFIGFTSISYPVYAEEDPEPIIEDGNIEEETVEEPEIIEEELIEEPALMAVRSTPLLGSSGTDPWLSEWDYEIKEVYRKGNSIVLKQYTGSGGDVTIYGKAAVSGSQYPVCIGAEYDDSIGRYITGVNCSENIINLRFESVEGEKVGYERYDRFDDLFYGMENLESITFGGNFAGNIVQASRMFDGCVNLKSVDTETIDFGGSTIYHRMFGDCRSLKKITIHCPRGYNMSSMFSGCSSLTDVTLSGCDGHALSLGDFFKNCTSLKNVDLSGFDLSKTTSLSGIFRNCSALETLDMSDIDLSSATSLSGMFAGCTSLRSIDLSATNFNGDGVSTGTMFYNCPNLEEITVAENFKPKYCADMMYVPNLTILKIKGNMSQEFKNNVLPYLKASNRYIGTVKLTALIELEGRDLEDCMFSVEQADEIGDSTAPACNYNSNGNRVELTGFVYIPGNTIFTVEEKYITKKQDGLPLETVSISRTDQITCENAIRSKVVDITLNTDGSLSVEV